MKSFTTVDLQMLARGQRVAGDVFRAVFADAEAVAELARLLQVRELLTATEAEWRPPADVPDMNVTWEELARHGEGRPLEPARCRAVEHFLEQHFPATDQALPAGGDTFLDFAGNDDTVEFRPEQG
jgi:hypothetical protein